MSGTFLCPNTCGFARVVALELSRKTAGSLRKQQGESSTKFQARVKQEIFKEFNIAFSECGEQFLIDSLKFHKKLPGLRATFTKWNFRKAKEKAEYLEVFSIENWKKLSSPRKKEHSFANCKGCKVRYVSTQAYFPVKSNVLKSKAKANPVFAADTEVRKLKENCKPTKTNIKNAAKAIYDKVSPLFEETFKTSFAEALAYLPELNLQCKTPNERRNDRRHYYRHSKKNMEKQMEETAFLRYISSYFTNNHIILLYYIILYISFDSIKQFNKLSYIVRKSYWCHKLNVHTLNVCNPYHYLILNSV